MSRVNVYLTFRMLLYFRNLMASLSNVKCGVMLSSDNGNILIIGFSFQGTVLNVFFSVFNVIRYNYITLHYISDLYSAPTVANNFLRRFTNTIHKI